MTLFWIGAACGSIATLVLFIAYSVGICWWLTKDPAP